MSRASDNYSYSWCPECKKWVPASCMTAEYDPVDDVLVRMCTHCENTLLAGQPSTVEEDGFDWNKCVLDEQRGWIRCPLCGFKGQPGHSIIEMVNLKKWHCINCHGDFQM